MCVCVCARVSMYVGTLRVCMCVGYVIMYGFYYWHVHYF